MFSGEWNRGRRNRPQRLVCSGFSLSELLVVIAVIAVLAGMLLPTLARAKAAANRTRCASNLRQTAMSFNSWAQDNGGVYPWMQPVDWDIQESIPQVSDYFRHLADELPTPQLFVCPSDRTASVGASWAAFGTKGNAALSYFVGLCATEAAPNTLLLGDRNVEGLSLLSECTNTTGLYAGGLQASSYWTREIHNEIGNVAFVDGRVESITSSALQQRASLPRVGAQCLGDHLLAPCRECVLPGF